MIKFNKIYFITSILLFIVEIVIAKYATGFIRHTFGDYLAVMLVYTMIKSAFNISIEKAALLTIAISFIIEFLQLSNLQNLYPVAYSKTYKIVLGTSFSIGDLVAYFLGVVTIVLIEKYVRKTRTSS